MVLDRFGMMCFIDIDIDCLNDIHELDSQSPFHWRTRGSRDQLTHAAFGRNR